MNTMESQNYTTPNNNFVLQQPVTVSHGTLSMTAVPQTFQPLPQPTWVPHTFTTQLPTTIQQAPWQMAPMTQNIVPVSTCMPMQVPTHVETVTAATKMFLLTPSGLQEIQPEEYCVSQNGNALCAPQGYTLVSKEEYFNMGWNNIPFPAGVPLLTPSPSPTVSRSPSVEQTVVTAEQTETPKKKNVVKRAHRAKQLKITEKHTSLRDYCILQGIFAKEDEVLRGEDVLRIHVKTWEGLDLIESVIQEVERNLDIARIALPFSQKNKFQKKGFICYLKVKDVVDVELVQNIFGQYSEAFKKCDVAMPTNKLQEKLADPVLMPFSLTPPTMAKRSSAA